MEDIIKNLYLNLSKYSDLTNIQKYIHKNWRKNHILSKNMKLFKWQHQFYKNKIDFLVKKKNKKIVSLLGVINQSRDKKYSEISLAIWHSLNKMSGLSLILDIFDNKTIKLIKATTISKNVHELYKSLGFNVQNFNQYYLTNLDKKNQKITKNLIKEKFTYTKRNNDIIYKKINELFFYKKNLPNKKYIEWRFCKNPVYEYYFLADKSLKLILICRVVAIKKLKFLSVVDFIGSFRGKKKFINKISQFLKNKKYHHLEFLHFGTEDLNILSSGLKQTNKKQILPLLTEPYIGLKKKEILCGYKSLTKITKIKIVRADGDADRPSKK